MKTTRSYRAVLLVFLLLTGCCVAITALGQSYPNSLWIGTDNTSSRQALNTDKNGTVLRSAPPGEVTGIAIDAANNRIFFGTSGGTITPYDLTTLAAGTPITPSTGFSEDMAFDGSCLWRAGLTDQTIYQIMPSDGTIVSSFSVPFSPMGVAWDGSALWLSAQFGGLVARYDTNGTPTGQQFTSGLTETGGLAYDTTDATLWVGTYGKVYHYSTSGTELGSFDIPAADGRFADGLEFQGVVVPEPSTVALFAIGGFVLFLMSQKKRLSRPLVWPVLRKQSDSEPTP